MDINRASGWQDKKDAFSEQVLQEAARCPICGKTPVLTVEEGFNTHLDVLRCPQQHAYAACGATLVQAVSHWNEYIALLIQADTQKMISQALKNSTSSYCRACQRYTVSLTSFDKNPGTKTQSGYSVIKQECKECHLIKSRTEAA